MIILHAATDQQYFQQHLTGEKNGNIFIKKDSFDDAVKDGQIIYSIAGKTMLKTTSTLDEKHRYLQGQDNTFYKLTECRFTKIVGYIPVENNSFVEYRKFNPLLLLPFFLLLIGCLSVALWNISKNGNVAKTQDPEFTIGYDNSQVSSEDSAGDTNEESRELPSVVMPGFNETTIPANETLIENKISLFNPEKNEGIYDLSFTIMVDVNHNGEFETLYQSGKVSPGMTINSFELTRSLDAGDYDARVLIQPYLIADDTIGLNNGVVNISLCVE